VPGDVRAANYLLCASQMVPQSRIDVRATSLNPTRHAVLDALRRLGAETGLTPESLALNEPAGLIAGRYAPLKGAAIGGEVGARLGDDLFPLAAVAARAQGQSVFSDLSASTVASLPRLAWLLGCFGISCRVDSTDLVVEGVGLRPLKAARVTTEGDHRMAMTAALLGLAADSTTEILDVQSVATAFPRFVGTLRALGARIEVKDA
jgi:3-phosphoshikimate 1-carboxyvinyltransferase